MLGYRREHEVALESQHMALRELVSFLTHQLISTFGVVVLSGMSWYSTVELLKLGRINVTWQLTTSVLLATQGFPFQAAGGMVLGFALTRRLCAKSVGFVWILPLLWFGFGALTVAPVSTLAYLVGGGCQPNRGCFYQLSFTLPLIASVSYALGGVVSRWLLRRSSGDRDSPAEPNSAEPGIKSDC